MTLFKSIFGTSEKKTQPKINWIALTDLGQLDEIIALSHQKAVVVFKHSSRCSVSRMALKQFETEFDLAVKVVPYFLDLLSYRELSNEIALRFAVTHQSPQVLVIKEGKSIYNASHSAIDATVLQTLCV